MGGYRDVDAIVIDCGMWDSLQNMLASIEQRLDALENRGQHDLTTLESSDSICNTCRAKTVCSSSSIGNIGHVVLECDEYIVEGTPCTHEPHADQTTGKNVCIRCGVTEDHF